MFLRTRLHEEIIGCFSRLVTVQRILTVFLLFWFCFRCWNTDDFYLSWIVRSPIMVTIVVCQLLVAEKFEEIFTKTFLWKKRVPQIKSLMKILFWDIHWFVFKDIVCLIPILLVFCIYTRVAVHIKYVFKNVK